MNGRRGDVKEVEMIITPYIKPGNEEITQDIILHLDNSIRVTSSARGRLIIPQVSLSLAQDILKKRKDKDFYQPSIEAYVGSSITVLLYEGGSDLMNELRRVIGDTDCSKAREGTIRRMFGRPQCEFGDAAYYNNAIHCPKTLEEVASDLDIWRRFLLGEC